MMSARRKLVEYRNLMLARKQGRLCSHGLSRTGSCPHCEQRRESLAIKRDARAQSDSEVLQRWLAQ